MSIEYQEKDPIYDEYDKLNSLNERTKKIYIDISKPSFDLFHNLTILRLKNNKTTLLKNKSKKMLADYHEIINKEEVLETLTKDLDLPNDEMSELDLYEKSKFRFFLKIKFSQDIYFQIQIKIFICLIFLL